MPISTISSDFPGVATALRAIVDGEGGPDRGELVLAVSANSATLVLTVTDIGPDGFLRPAVQTDLVLTDPRGERRQLTRLERGQIVTVIDKPEPGSWTLAVAGGSGARAEINAAAISFDPLPGLRRLGRWIGCKACRSALRAFIIALLAHVGPMILAGLGAAEALQRVAAVAHSVIEALQHILGPDLFGMLGDVLEDVLDNPVERLLRRICQKLGFCL